ncbi:hypothetical protein a10_09195 [Streptomyces acidiscabies]|nr:hypothetical protein a10_09195 [Streptomyces acidiscabies]
MPRPRRHPVHPSLRTRPRPDQITPRPPNIDPRRKPPRRVGNDDLRRPGEPEMPAPGRRDDDNRRRDGEEVAQAQLPQRASGIRIPLRIEIDPDEPMRRQPAGDPVPGRPRRHREERTDPRRIGRRVVHPMPGPPAFAVAGRGAGWIEAVGGAQRRELGAGQGDDGQAAFGGRERVGEGQRGGLPVGGGHGPSFAHPFEKREGAQTRTAVRDPATGRTAGTLHPMRRTGYGPHDAPGK